MVITNRVRAIFADAWTVYNGALERLEQGDIRDAAEKAWCATKRATDALTVAHTGEEPEKAPITSRELRRLALGDARLDSLVAWYCTNRDMLHGDCFYLGLCEPTEDTDRRIRETAICIQKAESLAE